MISFSPFSLSLIAIIVLIALYCFFALAEVAIVRSRSKRLLHEDGTSPKGSFERRAVAVLERADFYRLSCDVGMYICVLLTGWYAVSGLRGTGLISTPLRAGLDGNAGMLELMLTFICMALVCTVVTFMLVQVGKPLVAMKPERVLMAVVLPVQFFAWVLAPLTSLLQFLETWVGSAVGLDPLLQQEEAISAEEISEMVEQSSEAGEIQEEEREMIQGVFTFSDTTALEIMTPRKDVISVRENASLDQILRVFKQSGRSRILVTKKELDEVKGILLMKDLIPFLARGGTEFSLEKVMRPPYFIPGTKRLDDLLERFRRKAVHMAVVLDEHGGVQGIVTLEDVVEEIVGDIFDEYDSASQSQPVRETDSGDLVVEGGISIDDLNSKFNLSFPSGEYTTFAGFIFNLLGRIPTVGEVVDFHGLKIRVEELEQNRITRLRIMKGKVSRLNSIGSAHISETKSKTPHSNVWGDKPSTGGPIRAVESK